MKWFQKKKEIQKPPPKLHYKGRTFKVLSLNSADPQILALRLIPYKPYGVEYQIEVERLSDNPYRHTHQLRVLKIRSQVAIQVSILFGITAAILPATLSVKEPHALAIQVADKLAQYLASLRSTNDDTLIRHIDSLDFLHLFKKIVAIAREDA